jgi:hypothetical protein
MYTFAHKIGWQRYLRHFPPFHHHGPHSVRLFKVLAFSSTDLGVGNILLEFVHRFDLTWYHLFFFSIHICTELATSRNHGRCLGQYPAEEFLEELAEDQIFETMSPLSCSLSSAVLLFFFLVPVDSKSCLIFNPSARLNDPCMI